MWPDATLTNGGGYAPLVRQIGVTHIGATLRGDSFRVIAGTASDFFRTHAGDELDRRESALNAALNAQVVVTPRWMLTLGVGRAVRAPDTLERDSDRFPAGQFQVAAEFPGNPQLTTEKSLEVNAGILLGIPRTTIRADVFRRIIDDYITAVPDPRCPSASR